MSTALCAIAIGGLYMELRESRGPRYTLVFRLLDDPDEISITYLGDSRERAIETYVRKVEYHRAVVGS